MQNYQNVARSIKLFSVKILLLTCSVIKTLRIITGFQCGAPGFQLRALGFQFRALGSCLQKSINVNKNQQSARYIKLLKNVKLLKKYCYVSAGFGELK